MTDCLSQVSNLCNLILSKLNGKKWLPGKKEKLEQVNKWAKMHKRFST